VCAQSELKTLSWTVEGKADISGNNVASARTRALSAAFAEAIRSSLAEALGEKVLKERGKTVAEIFYKDLNQFVNRYKIVTEGPQDKSYLMQVDVELSADLMRVGLVQAGLVSAGSRVVILAVIEDDAGALKSDWITPAAPQALSEKFLTLELQSWGYRLARPDPVLEPAKLDRNLSDSAWLAKLREKYGAEILVLGKLELSAELKAKAGAGKSGAQNIEDTEEAGVDLYSAQCNLELTVIDLSAAEKSQVLETEQTLAAAGADSAKSKSIEAAVRSILPELSIALDRMSQAGLARGGGSQELLEVTGLISFDQYRQVYDQLKKIEAVRDLKLYGFAPGTVKFSIRFAGDNEALKKAITQTKDPEFRLLPIASDRQGLKFKFEAM
jgi:hypothetical protein